MADFDFGKSGGDTKGRFGAKQKPGDVSVPGASAGNSKLQVRSKDDPVSQEGDPGSLFAAPKENPDQGPQYGYKKHRFHKKDEVSVFDEEMDQRLAMDERGKKSIVLAVALVVLFLVAIFLPAEFFSVNGSGPTAAGFIEGVSTNVSGLLNYFTGATPNDPMGYKFFRYLIIIIAGAALGISGGVYQGALKNALASPTTLGVISGGTLGAMCYVIFIMPDNAEETVSAQSLIDYYGSLGPLEYVINMYGQAFCSLLGCFVVVGFVIAVATIAGKGKLSNVVLIVTGQVISVVMASVMTLIRTYYGSGMGGVTKATALQSVRSMAFSSHYTALDLVLVGVPILAGVIVILAMRMRLNALTFSDEEARSMGLSTNLTRNVMVGACTLMTAVVVAFCGSIGFVGFVVPHLTRRVVGPNFKYYIPATALVGALFMVAAYFVTSFFALEDFGGIKLLTSIIGGVAFIVIALAGRNRTTSDGF